MNEVGVLGKFIVRLENQNVCFFDSIVLPGQKKNIIYQYIMGVYKCANNDFASGMNILKQIQAIECIMWETLKKYDTESLDKFMKKYDENCDKMRRYYKLLRKE